VKLLQFAFKFYINASIHVALAVISFFAITVFEFNLQVSLSCWLFVFFGTVTGYNFVKYAKIAGLHHRSLTNSLRSIQVFSFVCFICFLVCAYFVSLQTIFITFFFGLLTFFYAVPFLRKKNLRTFSGVKIIIVALVWAGVTVFVPMVEVNMALTADCWLTFFQRFLLVVVLTLPFEIRDLRYDIGQLQTIPQQIGVRKTKILGIALLLVSLWLETFKATIVLKNLYGLVFLVLITGLALVLAKKKQSEYFAAFWVESIPIVGLFVLLLFFHCFP
jgi:4-hydroxybenzoate polyprenyltransferase